MPVDGSLMCNFNQVFKLDPVMFDLWLNITASSPHSSLVLLRYPPEAERYLRATMRLKVSGYMCALKALYSPAVKGAAGAAAAVIEQI